MRYAGYAKLPCPTRVEVRDTVACPRCGAVIGEECIESVGASRDRNHQERHKAAIVVLRARDGR